MLSGPWADEKKNVYENIADENPKVVMKDVSHLSEALDDDDAALARRVGIDLSLLVSSKAFQPFRLHLPLWGWYPQLQQHLLVHSYLVDQRLLSGHGSLALSLT